MVYDSGRSVVVLYGGGYAVDTWEYDGVTWTQTATSGPSSRIAHDMAYDAARGVTVLFGGTYAYDEFYDDTWKYDGVRWLHPPVYGPPARALHAMAYDAARACVVMQGGVDWGTYLDDTWEYDGSSWTVAPVGTSAVGRSMAYDDTHARTVWYEGGSGTSRFYDGTSWTVGATVSARNGSAVLQRAGARQPA